MRLALRMMADDAAALLRDAGAGAVVVRAMRTDEGLVLTGRVHGHMHGVTPHAEIVGFREVVDG